MAWTGFTYTFLGGATGQVQALPFDVVGVGPSSPNTSVAARLPLPVSIQIGTVVAVCQTLSGLCVFNIALGETSPYTGVPAVGATAIAGNIVFSTDQSIPAAGTVQQFTATNLATWPADSELTLRVTTPSGGGVGGLKVIVYGQVL